MPADCLLCGGTEEHEQDCPEFRPPPMPAEQADARARQVAHKFGWDEGSKQEYDAFVVGYRAAFKEKTVELQAAQERLRRFELAHTMHRDAHRDTGGGVEGCPACFPDLVLAAQQEPSE